MATRRNLKHPRDEDSEMDNSKRLRGDLDSVRETYVKRWMRSHSSWTRNLRHLDVVEEGDEKTELEQELVDELTLSMIEEGNEISAALRNLALEIVRAVERDLAVLPIELGKLYDAIHPPRVADTRKRSTMHLVSVRAQEKATVKSWASEYEGNGVDLFHKHIAHCCELSGAGSSLYGKSFVIVNSSGMGKSRMVDESSKTLFTVLFVLRDARGGFPPPDSNVLAYFQRTRTVNECETAMICFLKTLYDELITLLKDRQEEAGTQKHAELAYWFRGYLATWTHMYDPSPARVDFFTRVVKKAEEMQDIRATHASPPEKDGDRILSSEVSTKERSRKSEMIDSFSTLSALLEHDPKSPLPSLLLAFDEGHTLLQRVGRREDEASIYSVLRRVLLYLDEKPQMSCFISTSTSIVEQSAPPMRLNPSSRMQSGLYRSLPAFTSLPLNMTRIQPDEMDLTLVSRDDFMCKQSRILFRTRAEHGVDSDVGENLGSFAMEKLVGASYGLDFDDGQKLAILARRIPIHMQTDTSASLRTINEQIARHMRVLYRITDNNETLITGSPSEPIISEGAKAAMATFNAADALRRIFVSPGISVDDRGQMVAALLMILASDAATKYGKFSIPAFFKCLLTDVSWMTLKSSQASHGRIFHPERFEQTFENSFGNFNHVIKVYGNVPRSNSLYRYLTRRAAISTLFAQPGVDGAFPYTIDETKITPDNTSFAIIQTNAEAGMQIPPKSAFDNMNSIVRQMHDYHDAESTPAPKHKNKYKPVIRMIFSLQSKETDLVVMEYEDADDELVTWDIYVPFLALGAVQENAGMWQSVLETGLQSGSIYDGDVTLMGMDPGAKDGDEFWPNWAPTEEGSSGHTRDAKVKEEGKGSSNPKGKGKASR
ncbi:hypothetical protein DACRYDRAFT_115996 [Dacryopinax primogenitus]|uniref:Uncharacterized protein n=1 Tax=Dacryopinax primogenitus (strain DJM 731) TaxID=1858805 RepID=M5G224_DACPD|nr:uncharacterized protein DACRYDRAFT_115996 [Dacryopinax primogenitus]EJU02265.1 hypothetical protein DACRYDRAFT_115996 [Dacryopinax primogenitus]